jgi:hypothetical protein
MTMAAAAACNSLGENRTLTHRLSTLNARTEWFTDVSRSVEDNVGPFVLVVDDFYSDPKAIRALALKQSFIQYSPPLVEQVGEAVAARYRGQGGLWLSSALFVFAGKIVRSPFTGFAYRPVTLRDRLQKVVAESISQHSWENGGDGWNGVFHLIDASWTPYRGSIHHHYKPGDVERGWSGLVYLSPDAPPSSGTSIWRDKTTGLCVASYGAKFEYELPRFELALLVENRFNRLLLFRENVLHRAEHGFGVGRNSRLTQTFFFCTERKNQLPQ